MSVPTPLFQSYGALRAALRLSGIRAGSDAEVQFDNAVMAARLQFWRRLGKYRVDSLVAMTETTEPSTENEHLRALATITEQKVVRAELLQTMITAFKDGGGEFVQSWQHEAAFRNSNPFVAKQERDRLLAEIEESMQILAGSESAGSEKAIQISTIEAVGREGDTLAIGESVLGKGGIFSGF